MEQLQKTYTWQFDDSFSFNRSRNDNVFDCPSHLHDGFELYYLIGGNVDYHIESSRYHMCCGDLLVIPGQELHRAVVHPGTPYERITIHFAEEYLQGFDDTSYNLLSCFLHRKPGISNRIDAAKVKGDGLYGALLAIEKLWNCDSPQKSIRIKLALIRLLLVVNAACEDNFAFEESPDNKINQAVQYINAHLEDNLSLDFLASQLYLNKHYLCHKFKQDTGLTLTEYIQSQRAHKAHALLRSGIPSTQVAIDCGFNDYSHFFRVFKKYIGKSPSAVLRTG